MSCLKYCVGLVWVLVLIVAAQPCFAPPLQHWTVQVSNDMKSSHALFLHFKSKDDDFGQKNLEVGEQFSWRFREHLWQTTLYWCSMHNQHSHVSLKVFWPETVLKYWLTDRCNDEDCIWSVRDDGIYLKNIPENKFELHAKWDPGSWSEF